MVITPPSVPEIATTRSGTALGKTPAVAPLLHLGGGQAPLKVSGCPSVSFLLFN
jgi:hypothetical protein